MKLFRSCPPLLLLALLVIAPTATGCGGEAGDPTTPETWMHLGASEVQARADQVATAEGARGVMFSTLLRELMAAMRSGGPSAAVAVCSERAQAIASEVGEARGVRIGRTSFRLRNKVNQPPEWAAAAVAARSETEMIYGHEDGRLAVLSPIRIMGTCLTCHGKPEDLGEGVAAILAERYPDDAATGFADGDLRGWFWVEVPAPSR